MIRSMTRAVGLIGLVAVLSSGCATTDPGSSTGVSGGPIPADSKFAKVQIGMTMKEFMGFKVFSTSAITAGKNMAYHTSSVGLGINSDVSTEINYVPEKVSHLATSMMSMGCTVIDDNGVYEVLDNN